MIYINIHCRGVYFVRATSRHIS